MKYTLRVSFPLFLFPLVSSCFLSDQFPVRRLPVEEWLNNKTQGRQENRESSNFSSEKHFPCRVLLSFSVRLYFRNVSFFLFYFTAIVILGLTKSSYALQPWPCFSYFFFFFKRAVRWRKVPPVIEGTAFSQRYWSLLQ